MALEPGQVIDSKYRVVRLIGEGGMGTVYEGEFTRIGKRVAIKVLHAQVASMPEFVERFEREARAAARIGSPHVCDVLDLGDLPNGDRYLVMEYLDGISFEDRLEERKRLTPAQLAPIAFELLEGLGTMHASRVIHRDLKPANVFLARTSSGRGEVVKILDFGVAKLLPLGGEVTSMTQTGMMMGTPLYMSPEQARGAKEVDGRTDIYAASVMFYRALTGELPYMGETLNELLFKIVLEEPKPIRELMPDIDEVFAALVHKGLARDLAARYQTAREYQEAIAAWGKSQGRTSLSFAVTVPSEPPPPMPPMTPTSAPSPVASAGGSAAVSVNAGTPTAWSEDGPEVAKAAVRPAAGATVSDAAANASARSAPVDPAALAMATTTAVPSEPPPSGPWAEGPGVPPSAQAKTGPGAVAPAFAGTPQKAASRRPLVIAVLGVGAIAIAGFGFYGRSASTNTSTGSTSNATSSATTAAQPNASDTAAAVTTAPVASAAASAVVGTPTDAANATDPTAATSMTTAVAAPTSVRHDVPAGGTRKTTPPQASAATTASVVVAAPVTSAPPTTTAKPAASSRKFRTNID